MKMWLYLCVVIAYSQLNAVHTQECIQYEFHEKAVHNPRRSELVSAACEKKGGQVAKYVSVVMNTAGPPLFNVTFQCCVNKKCYSDFDCSFNFQCKSGKCRIAQCALSDSLDVLLREDEQCFISEDCYFPVPDDMKNWQCLRDANCGVTKNCSTNTRFCKRCGTGYYREMPKKPTSTTVREDFTEVTTEKVTTTSTTTTTTATPTTSELLSTVISTEEVSRNTSIVTDNLYMNVTTIGDSEFNATTTESLNVTSSVTLETTPLPLFSETNNTINTIDYDFNAINELNNTLFFDSRNETRNEIH